MPSTATSILDGLSASVAVKAPVKAVTTANITLAGLQTVGGVALAENDRVLVKDQTTTTQNGIYSASTGSWRRTKDFDGNRDVRQGTVIIANIDNGEGLLYRVTSSDPVVIDTSAILFETIVDPNRVYVQTVTEALANATPANFAYPSEPEDVRRWGASDQGGVTDSTAEIQDAFDALNAGSIKGGVVKLYGDNNSVYNISDSLLVPKYVSGDNHSRAFQLEGMSLGAPRLRAKTGLENKAMIDGSGNSTGPVYSLYRGYNDLYLDCAAIAQCGLDLQYTQHGKISNIFITGAVNGSGTAAGLKVHNGQGHGFAALGGSGNFFNANLMHGCVFLDLTGDGQYFSGGVSGCSFTANTYEFCDGYGIRLAGFSHSSGFFGGNYLEANGLGDMYLGEDAAMGSFIVEGNYFNGYTGGSQSSAYTPIKIKFSTGVALRNNMIAQNAKSATGYYILDANISGGSISNTIVEGNFVDGLTTTTPPNQIYNLPGTWVDQSNRLHDELFAPLIESNLCRGPLPYGGWSLNISGSGTAARGATLVGAPSIRLVRPGAGDSSSISQVFTIGPEYKNRFVTVAVPVFANAASKSLLVAISPNGTSPQTTTIDVNTLGANEQRIAYAMAFAPADATTITVSITTNSAAADFTVGHPCLYVGARQWYSAVCDQLWRANAAPTTGTWAVGDTVLDSVPVSGAQMGWMCTVAGTPGTWVALANLA
jgi:hypothetical protein